MSSVQINECSVESNLLIGDFKNSFNSLWNDKLDNIYQMNILTTWLRRPLNNQTDFQHLQNDSHREVSQMTYTFLSRMNKCFTLSCSHLLKDMGSDGTGKNTSNACFSNVRNIVFYIKKFYFYDFLKYLT